MKRILLFICITLVASFLFLSKEGSIIKNTALTYVMPVNYIHEAGLTISERIKVPEGFKRTLYEPGTFQHYIQQYPLKEAGAKVINYDGSEYGYQNGHVGVLNIPVPSNGLQQCADALIRIRAEYLWNTERKEEIGFNFTSGHYCSWTQYAKGYRPKVKGNKVSFHKTALPDHSKENFYKYLNLIYMYAGTQSLYDELPQVNNIDAIDVGDMLIYPGSPGHVIMVVDKVVSDTGKKMFIFAQGNTPAQSVHLLKNPNEFSISPWYTFEMGASLEIPTYYFSEVKFMRFK